MKITVIIPTLDEQDIVPKAIRSAQRGNADQIIVCDGGSKDNTIQVATELNCQVIQSSAGRGKQMASGAAHADGDILLFLHADCELTSGCLDQIRENVSEAMDAVNGNQPERYPWGCFMHRIDADGWQFRWLEKGNHWRARKRGLVYGDQALWVHRDTYKQVGGFPDVPLMEDVKVSDRLKKLTKPLVLAGPVTISARHWQRRGVFWTTIRNQVLLAMYRFGLSAERVAELYRR